MAVLLQMQEQCGLWEAKYKVYIKSFNPACNGWYTISMTNGQIILTLMEEALHLWLIVDAS